jgi:hypothetical protein
LAVFEISVRTVAPKPYRFHVVSELGPHQVSQRVVRRKLFPHGIDPSTPVAPQHRGNLATGQQPDPVPIHTLDRQQLVGHARRKYLTRCWHSVGVTIGAAGRVDLKGPQISQQATDRFIHLLLIAFVASDAARWITGAIIPVDGGSKL